MKNKELISKLENYYISIDILKTGMESLFQFYIKKTDLDDKTLEKKDKFKNKLLEKDHKEFNSYKYLTQEYIFSD